MKSVRAVLATVLVGLLGLSFAIVPGGQPAWAAGTLGLSQQLSFSGSAGTAFDVPSGSGVILAINYSCGNENCVDSRIVVPVPSGLTIGSMDLVAGATSSVSGSTITITLPASLAAGSAGQLTVNLGVPAWTTANGAVFSWASSISATGSTGVDSNSVTITSRAASTSRASLSVSSGGAIDEPVTFRAEVCVEAVPGSSAVAVATGSIVTVTLPAGATFVSATSPGVHSAGAIRWTLGQHTGCGSVFYTVVFDSADPANSAGASVDTDLTWTGNYIGNSGSITLGTASLQSELEAPEVSVTTNKWSFSGEAAIDTQVTYFLAIANQGNTTVDELVIEDIIPDPLKVTSINSSMPTVGSAPGELWVASRLGPDGVVGGGDDGTLVLAAELPASGSGVGIAVYGSGTWPSGAAQLPADDLVERIVVRMLDVGPGQGGDRVSFVATVMGESFDGVETEVGDLIKNVATFDYRVVSGALDESDEVVDDHTITVAPQVPTVTTSLGGGGTLAPGVRETTAVLGAGTGPFALRNPVLTLILPATVTMTDWTPSSTTVLPAATLTTVEDWQGSGATLHRWTYPAGTVLATGVGYSITADLELDEEAWGSLLVRGYVSSASDPYYCTWNFWEGGPDTQDRDGDGDTAEVLCNWSFSVSPAPSTSASLTVEVDSAYSSGFVTGTVYTAPGSEDDYRLTLRNTGTLPLNSLVVVAVLPRPGDAFTLSSGQRNPATSTFPVLLTGAAVAPTLGSSVTVSYSTQTLPCLPELARSASGCTAAGWSTTIPADPATVTAVKIDFGANTLNPFVTWRVTLPVTTPTSGAAEPDIAEINPDPTDPTADERASGSAAFAAVTQSSTSLTAESSVVSLRIPSVDGAAGVPPAVADRSTSGTGTDPQSTTVPIPSGGEVMLLDGSTEVTTLVVPGEGSYTLDPDTGVITFEPELGFSGTATPVRFVVRNSFGAEAVGEYVPSVTPPPGPSAVDLSSVFVDGPRVQSVTVAVPASGSLRLLDAGGGPVTSVVVPGQGVYTVDSATGVITFTALPGFQGVPDPVGYRITDAWGQSASAIYAPGVFPAAPAGGLLSQTGASVGGSVLLAVGLLVAGLVVAVGGRRGGRDREASSASAEGEPIR